MLNNYCLVCSDVNSFNGKVFQLENVLKRFVIDCYKQEKEVRDEELNKVSRILGF